MNLTPIHTGRFIQRPNYQTVSWARRIMERAFPALARWRKKRLDTKMNAATKVLSELSERYGPDIVLVKHSETHRFTEVDFAAAEEQVLKHLVDPERDQ